MDIHFLSERVKMMTETVGKQELVKRIAEQTEITQKQAGEILDVTLTTLKQALQEGRDVRIIGFGSFAVRQASARTAINPRTREAMQIPAKKRVRFSAGRNLVEAVQ
jgi:DNA-binding protein HU-beta